MEREKKKKRGWGVGMGGRGGLEARWMRRGVRSGGEMRTGGEVGREVLQKAAKGGVEGWVADNEAGGAA